MIHTTFMGNFGNCLFQYSFARLLQEKTGYKLWFPDEEISKLTRYFPGIVTGIEGKIVDKEPEFIVGEGTLRQSRTIGFDELAWACLEEKRKLRVIGYFERSYLYLPERDKLRSWFSFDRTRRYDCPVVNIRGSERRQMTLEEADYYRKAVQRVGNRAIIVTEDPTWDFVRSLGLPVVHFGPLEDFKICANAPELVIGRSTFSWWTAFLGSAQRVIQPEPQRLWRCPGEYFYGYLGVPNWEKISMD